MKIQITALFFSVLAMSPTTFAVGPKDAEIVTKVAQALGVSHNGRYNNFSGVGGCGGGVELETNLSLRLDLIGVERRTYFYLAYGAEIVAFEETKRKISVETIEGKDRHKLIIERSHGAGSGYYLVTHEVNGRKNTCLAGIRSAY